MSAGRQWAVVAAVVGVLALALVLLTRTVGQSVEHVGIGAQAPAFSARTLDEPPAMRSLADYRGNVVLLNIWATWCLPCRVEMPSMQRVYEAYGDSGLRVVAVSIDVAGAEAAIREFVGEYGLTFDILYDPESEITKIYQTSGVPYSFVIDRSGKIRKTVLGATDWSSQGNRSLISSLLAEGS